MKTKITGFIAAILVAMLAATVVFAQEDAIKAAAGDKYVISAKAGGVNFVEGTVGIVRMLGKSGVLLKRDTLEIGDRVSTGADGKAEILLNPGSYLRLGGNSAFEFVTTSLDDLQLKVDRGSAILEVFASDEFAVTVATPKGKFDLIQSGIYRVDVAADGTGRLEVWKGKAEIGGGEAIKGGRVADLDGGQVEVAKFDRDEKDEFELWSKARAKELSKISGDLKRRELRTLLASSYLGGRWSLRDSFGLWVYDPFRSAFCFLPFGYGWSSPYGYGFGHNIWWYQPYIPWYNPPIRTGGNSGNGNGGNNQDTPVRSAGDRSPTPPFIRMGGSDSATGRGGLGRGGRGDGPMIDSGPVYSPPPVSTPAPVRINPSSPNKGKGDN